MVAVQNICTLPSTYILLFVHRPRQCFCFVSNSAFLHDQFIIVNNVINHVEFTVYMLVGILFCCMILNNLHQSL